MKSPLLIAILALLCGIAVGAYWVREPALPAAADVADRPAPTSRAQPANAGSSPGSDEIAELRSRLNQEIEARQRLQARLDQLSERVAGLSFEASFSETPPAVAESEPSDRRAVDANQDWFDEQALLANGIDSSLARELREFYEQIEMQRLQLRDQSVREGWERSRLRDELRQLGESEQELRQRLGEPAYDAYLYASGRPNRVAVTSVLASAQAGQAGIQPGDLIRRYDNEPIYNWRDLRDATTGGNIGESIALEVERDGDVIEYYLSRGPLGIRMDSVSVAPN